MKFFTGLIALLLFMGCQKSELKLPANAPCAATTQHDIVGVSGPTSISKNQPANFSVTWKALNGCDNFVKFSSDTVGNTINIKTFASHDSCSVCNTVAEYKTAAYTATPSKSGTFYLKFYRAGKDSSAAITDTLFVK